MNKLSLTAMLVLVAASLSVNAQEAEAKAPATPPQFPPRPRIANPDAIKEFDKDGDGKLNDEERKAMMEARRAQFEKVRAEREKEFDKDGDGKLNEAEHKAMMEARAKRMGEREGGKREGARPPAEGGKRPERPQRPQRQEAAK